MMKLGIQVSSLKPLLLSKEQVDESFAKMATLGWDTVQLQWIDPSVEIRDIAAALEKNRIQSVSVQDFYELVERDFEYYVNLNTATGGTWLCVSRIPENCKSRAGLDVFIGKLRDMAARLPQGQKLCLHPVTGDFRAVDGMDAVAYILEHYPELDICFDLYHLNRCCDDMPSYLRRYKGRICMVHFKDAVGDTLVPAGQGQVNWTGVLDACRETGVAYGFAEQEKWDKDPYECLKEAMDWIGANLR